MRRILLLTTVISLTVLAAGAEAPVLNPDVLTAPYLYYIGHASVMIETAEGTVIYIDPFAEGDYSKPADLILITHSHRDHNKPELCAKNEDCTIITWAEALTDGTYNVFDVKGVNVQPVPAANANHPIESCVGYVLTFDGLRFYHAGDTSYLDSMADLAELAIDYAMYPVDGRYNMDAEEATRVAETVAAKHSIPMHFMDASMVDALQAAFTPENALYVDYGDHLTLTH